MGKYIGSAGYDATFFCAGSGSTEGGLTAELCQVSLSANERAARFRGVAVSEAGAVLEVEAVGWMVPDEGWVLSAQDGDLRLSLVASPSATVLLAVSGGETSWTGWLEISFTQNYAP